MLMEQSIYWKQLDSFLKTTKLTNLLSTLIITTDKVYLNKEWDWGYREIDPLGGTDHTVAVKPALN